MNDGIYDFDDESQGYKVTPPKGVTQMTTKNKKQPQNFTLEPKAKNVENILQITPEIQLRDLCPIWKTSFSPQPSEYMMFN